jgi:hypothetical protein
VANEAASHRLIPLKGWLSLSQSVYKLYVIVLNGLVIGLLICIAVNVRANETKARTHAMQPSSGS